MNPKTIDSIVKKIKETGTSERKRPFETYET